MEKKGHHCYFCGKRFLDKYKLRKHVETHVEKDHPCSLCDKAFTSTNALCRHRRRHHDSSAPYLCEQCGKTLLNRFTLKRHRLIHLAHSEKGITEYRCSICDKVCNNSYLLDAHMLQHSGKRPHKCRFCGMDFAMVATMKIHMQRKHDSCALDDSFGTFSCDECGCKFKSYSSLYNHKTVHSDSRPFVCSTCGKTFKRKLTMQVHEKSHVEPKTIVLGNFECPDCDKVFQRYQNLSQHRKVHSKVRIHKCMECEMTFKRSDHLCNHIRTHGGFKCRFCDFAGQRRALLEEHLLQVHGSEAKK